MNSKEMLQDWAQTACDRIVGWRCYPRPSSAPAKIIAHRGAWNRTDRPENTMAAFREARRLGAWGIEFDLRFSRDGCAMIHHDPDLVRCYGSPGKLAELSRSELTEISTSICEFSEVVQLPDLHFLIEVKEILTSAQWRVLRELLSGKRPCEDYHWLALNPELVSVNEIAPPTSWILVGELFLQRWIEVSLRRGLGGVAGHYLGLNKSSLNRIHAAGLLAGTGFIPNANLYRREWARGVDWVFTNRLSSVVQN